MYLGLTVNLEAVIISGVDSILLHACTVVAHPHGTDAWSLAAFGLLVFCSGCAHIHTHIYTCRVDAPQQIVNRIAKCHAQFKLMPYSGFSSVYHLYRGLVCRR